MSTKHVFIIAEAGVNHNGSLDTAKKLIDAACETQADAVKFQTFKAELLTTRNVEKAEYQKKNVGGSESQFEMLKQLELSERDFLELRDYCRKKGIRFLSTPFDNESARFLIEELGMDLIKVPSGETINHSFLEYLASFNKPMIVSTGMCTLEEVKEAVHTIKKNGHSKDLTLLQCTTSYPCPPQDVNLKAMLTLKETFNLPIGYSDHTMGFEISLAAVALGATVIEKHFTLDRDMKGPDHRCSLIPSELKQMVQAIRNVELALGEGIKAPTLAEEEIKQFVRKTVVLNRDLVKGTVLKKENLDVKRAKGDILPQSLNYVVGKKLQTDKQKNEPLFWKELN